MDTSMSEWNLGRVRKSIYKGADVVFMLFTFSKHGGKSDVLGEMFKMKGPSFEKLVIGFMKVFTHPPYETHLKKG